MPLSTVATEQETNEDNMDPRIDQMQCALRDLSYEIDGHEDLIRQLGMAVFSIIKATVGDNDIDKTTEWAVEHGLAIIQIEQDIIDSIEQDDNGEI